MNLSREAVFLLWMAGVGTLILIMIPGIRDLLKAIFGSLLTPAFLAILKSLAGWMLWLTKKVMQAHLVWFRNLLQPHSAVFPTLERDASEKR